MGTPTKYRAIQRGTFLVVDIANPFRRLQIYGEVVRQQDSVLAVSCAESAAELALLSADWISCQRRSVDVKLLVNFPFIKGKEAMPASLVSIKSTIIELDLRPIAVNRNQRIALRSSISLPVRVHRQSGSILDGHTVDVSGGGAQLKLDGMLDKQELIELTMTLPVEKEAELRSKARVIWLKQVKNEYFFGISFVDLEMNEVKRLCRLALRAAKHLSIAVSEKKSM